MKYSAIFILLVSFLTSCKKENNSSNAATTLATLTTSAISSVTSTTATSGGQISSDGGSSITARGICWSTNSNPSVIDNYTIDGAGIGSFTSSISGLINSTTYYVRAYATNSAGTAYGNQISFIAGVTQNVYVAGYESNSTYTSYAKIWKNGVAIPLTDGTDFAVANSVFVSGTDLYAVGNRSNGTYGKAVIWKNGVETELNPGSSYREAYSIYVSGNDVYVAGAENSIPKVWKNGIGTSLSTGTSTSSSYASSVYVSGNDVYVLTKEGSSVVLWKNGVPSILTNYSGFSSIIRDEVFVSGTDVYVGSGIQISISSCIATIWKNGAATSLSNGTYQAQAGSIFVSGPDVYVAGIEEDNLGRIVGKIWKNGVSTSLNGGSTTGSSAYPRSVYVLGSKVYATGSTIPVSKHVVTVWENGVATLWTNGLNDAFAYDMFVTN